MEMNGSNDPHIEVITSPMIHYKAAPWYAIRSKRKMWTQDEDCKTSDYIEISM